MSNLIYCIAFGFSVLNFNIHAVNHSFFPMIADTSRINHVQDGLVSEWPDSVFQTDKGTKIQYARDNDAQNLYVAMKIPDFGMQMKLVRMGMNLYIDLKGKKKENRGIEFPIKRESEGGPDSYRGSGGNFNQQNQQRGFDKKAMRSRYAIYMLSMKLFGFTDDDPTPQELQREGSANLNYSWDSTDVMYIEYLIPINMLGDAASLNNKTINIGWKINGVDMSGFNNIVSTLTTPTRSSNGRTTNSRTLPSTNTNSSSQNTDSMMEEKSFWSKYTFH